MCILCSREPVRFTRYCEKIDSSGRLSCILTARPVLFGFRTEPSAPKIGRRYFECARESTPKLTTSDLKQDEVEVAEVVVAEEAATDEAPAEGTSTEDAVADEAAAEEASEDSDEA